MVFRLFVLFVCLFYSPALLAGEFPSPEQARLTFFPEATHFETRALAFSKSQLKAIRRASGVKLYPKRLQSWDVLGDSRRLGWFFVDDVVGKHEFITIGVGISDVGEVIGLEILDYRETHGGEVGRASWRAQFLGKQYGDPMRLGDGIDGISGATLSVRNVTDGVRKLMSVYYLELRE